MRFRNPVITSILLGLLLAGCGLPTGFGQAPEQGADSLQAEATTPATYYKTAEGKTGNELLKALNKIIKKHTVLTYDGARDEMFANIDDPTNTDTVVCVYTGRTLKGVHDRDSAYQKGAGFSTEHTWPQSMGAKTEPARSDLHHLFPVDTRINSVRSNSPFGNVKNALQEFPLMEVVDRVKTGIDVSGQQVFEPRKAHKGNVARAIFYFYTTYAVSKSPGVWLDNFRVEHDTLLKWHREDPVDADERRRNEAIYKLQKNRNPFIDHPEYVSAIGAFPAR
ncbi:endonuclease [bacterium]|nr:endonuclease [bacterium]